MGIFLGLLLAVRWTATSCHGLPPRCATRPAVGETHASIAVSCFFPCLGGEAGPYRGKEYCRARAHQWCSVSPTDLLTGVVRCFVSWEILSALTGAYNLRFTSVAFPSLPPHVDTCGTRKRLLIITLALSVTVLNNTKSLRAYRVLLPDHANESTSRRVPLCVSKALPRGTSKSSS